VLFWYFSVDADLRIPKPTDGLVRCVARSASALVVLEERRGDEKERDRGVNEALIGDVDVGQLLVHRLIQRHHRHHVRVRYEPKRT